MPCSLTIDGYHGDREQVDALNEDEKVKLAEVASPDAIVDPRAMVVIPIDTAVTECAMAAPGRAHDRAVRAEAASLHLIKQVHEVQVGVALDETRV